MKLHLIRFLTFGAMMASWTYFVIFARDLGVSNSGIGLIVSLTSLAQFLSFFVFGRASDRFGRKPFLLVGLPLSALALFLLVYAQGFSSLLLIRVFAGFCLGIFPAALIAHVYEAGENLSRFSSFGSLGWASGTLVAGLIATAYSINGVFIFSALLFLMALATALTIRFEAHRSIDVPKLPVRIVKKNLPLYLSILIRHTGAHMIWTFWPIFLQSLGASLFWVGVIQTINSLAQFIFMFLISSRVRYVYSVGAGLVLSSITFLSFTLAADFWQIIPTQILLGVSWSLMYVGGLRYLTDKNLEKATVSGLFDSVLSFSSIIGPFIGTFIVAFGGYQATMYIASAFALGGFLLFTISTRLYTHI